MRKEDSQLLKVSSLKSVEVGGFTSWHMAIAESPFFLSGISDMPYKLGKARLEANQRCTFADVLRGWIAAIQSKAFSVPPNNSKEVFSWSDFSAGRQTPIFVALLNQLPRKLSQINENNKGAKSPRTHQGEITH